MFFAFGVIPAEENGPLDEFLDSNGNFINGAICYGIGFTRNSVHGYEGLSSKKNGGFDIMNKMTKGALSKLFGGKRVKAKGRYVLLKNKKKELKMLKYVIQTMPEEELNFKDLAKLIVEDVEYMIKKYGKRAVLLIRL